MKKKKTYVMTVTRTFLKGHPKHGQETKFVEKVLNGEKIHTIRGNYDRYKKIVDEVNKGLAILSLRYWSGKPYRSKQVVIKEFEKLGIEPVYVYAEHEFCCLSDTGFELKDIERNDGLDLHEFWSWFTSDLDGAIIHFTDFRYSK